MTTIKRRHLFGVSWHQFLLRDTIYKCCLNTDSSMKYNPVLDYVRHKGLDKNIFSSFAMEYQKGTPKNLINVNINIKQTRVAPRIALSCDIHKA